MIKSHPKNFTQFWNVVEKVGRNGSLRRELVRWILSQRPNVFTRWLLSKWWKDLSLPRSTGQLRSTVLYRLSTFFPLFLARGIISQRKRLVKRFPSLLYILDDLPPCERLRTLWYLAKRKVEFLPVLLDFMRSIPCPEERERIEEAIRRHYPRLLKEISTGL